MEEIPKLDSLLESNYYSFMCISHNEPQYKVDNMKAYK